MEDPKLIEHIKKEIKKSGHSVSVKVSRILNSKDWYVQDSSRFKINENDENFFEIDVFATRESPFAGKSIDCLCIECKKQEGKNWVFFKQNKVNEDVNTLTFIDSNMDEDGLLDKIEKSKWFARHHYYQKPLCTYYFITDLNPKDRSALIDKGVEQVLQAVSFYSRRNRGYFAYPEFYYPIIVFDGNIFVASLDGENIDVESSNHICLYIEREFSKPYQTTTNTLKLSKPYIIDIVKLDWFESFLKSSF
jgi:hypothetical protein